MLKIVASYRENKKVGESAANSYGHNHLTVKLLTTQT